MNGAHEIWHNQRNDDITNRADTVPRLEILVNQRPTKRNNERTPMAAKPEFPLSKCEKVFARKNDSAETRAETAEAVAN